MKGAPLLWSVAARRDPADGNEDTGSAEARNRLRWAKTGWSVNGPDG